MAASASLFFRRGKRRCTWRPMLCPTCHVCRCHLQDCSREMTVSQGSTVKPQRQIWERERERKWIIALKIGSHDCKGWELSQAEDPGEPLFSFQSKATSFEAPEELKSQLESKVSVCLSRCLSVYLSLSCLGKGQFLFNVQIFSWLVRALPH